MNGTTIAGGCLCGQVRFRTDRAPLMARACWCRDCQYLSSGNASINLIVPSDGLEITGRTQEFVSVADSGNVMRRRFCPSCGTQLFSESVDHPERLVVRAGALDDPELARPSGIIWTASAPSWGWMDRDLPRSGGQPAAAPAPES